MIDIQKERNELSHIDTEPPEDAEANLRGAIMGSIGTQFLSGNRVDVLRNGIEIFPSMLEAISNAKHTIDFVTFIYWKGEIAQRLAESLAARARAGVRVRVVLDAFGSAPMSQSLIRRMAAAGVAVERFRPVIRWKFWESDHRTHRKVAVVDDRIAFTGGVGIASEWEGDARNPAEWRDTHFRFEGPVVRHLKATFLTDWRDTGHPIDVTDARSLPRESPGEVECAVIDGSVQIGYNDAERAIEALIAVASQRIVIQTPYFNPSEAVHDLLRDALLRGVSVDLLVPGPHIDKTVSRIMAEKMYLPLLEEGMRVWIYQPTMMHTKALLVDGVVSVVGSMNLNRRSVKKDEETAVAVLDRDITSTLETHFREDVMRSNPAEPEKEGNRLGRKIATKILGPVQDEM